MGNAEKIHCCLHRRVSFYSSMPIFALEMGRFGLISESMLIWREAAVAVIAWFWSLSFRKGARALRSGPGMGVVARPRCSLGCRVECRQCECPILLCPTGPRGGYHHNRWRTEVDDRTIRQPHGTQEIKSPGLCNIHQRVVRHHVVSQLVQEAWPSLLRVTLLQRGASESRQYQIFFKHCRNKLLLSHRPLNISLAWLIFY